MSNKVESLSSNKEENIKRMKVAEAEYIKYFKTFDMDKRKVLFNCLNPHYKNLVKHLVED